MSGYDTRTDAVHQTVRTMSAWKMEKIVLVASKACWERDKTIQWILIEKNSNRCFRSERIDFRNRVAQNERVVLRLTRTDFKKSVGKLQPSSDIVIMYTESTRNSFIHQQN